MTKIEIDGYRHIADEFDRLPRVAQLAVIRSTNRAIASADSFMATAVAGDLGIKKSAAKSAMSQRKATLSRPSAVVAAKLKRIPLIKLEARGPSRGKGRGVSYRLAGSRQRVDVAFIARMPNRYEGVFKRLGYSSTKTRSREAIGELAGPSIGHVFGKFRAAGLAHAHARFGVELDREIDFRKAKAAGRP
jgi:hypothetical protein